MVLSHGASLCGRYSIQSVLGDAGPFDVTYLAWDVDTEREVVIREYFPLNLCRRAADGHSLEVREVRLFEFGLAAYRRETELLSEFEHPCIVQGIGLFQENGTLYRVSNLVSGASLAAMMKQRNDVLAEEEALDLLEPLMEGLSAAHDMHLYHGSLSPRSIFIAEGGQPTLLNFQMARTRLAQYCGEDLSTTGYTPADTLAGNTFATWDVYSFGALLYHVLVGRSLPPAVHKAEHHHVRQAIKYNNRLAPEMRRLLLDCLAYDARERLSSMHVLLKRLKKVIRRPALEQHVAGKMNDVEVGFDDTPSGMKQTQSNDTPNSVDFREYTVLQESAQPVYSFESHTPAASPESDLHMQTKPTTPPETAQRIPSTRPDYLPRTIEGESDLEEVLTNVVKRQQQFIMAVIALAVLVFGLIGGIYLAPKLLNQQSETMPLSASADTPPATLPPAAATAPNESQGDGALLSPAAPLEEAQEQEEAVEQAGISEAEEIVAVDETPIELEDTAEETIQPPVNSEPITPEPEESPVREEAEPEPASQTPSTSSVAEAVIEEPAVSESAAVIAEAEMENERQFRYLLGQGDALFNQNQIEEALQSYEDALEFRPDDAGLSERIENLRNTLLEEERRLAEEESLRVRLSKVTDVNGIFIAPDTAPVLLNEAELSKQVVYPPGARRAEIQGRVIVRMMVTDTGDIESPQVVQGLGFGCDEEVLRVLGLAQFEPATFNSQPVKAWFMYSLVFSLD